jgi:hypothetical protein
MAHSLFALIAKQGDTDVVTMLFDERLDAEDIAAEMRRRGRQVSVHVYQATVGRDGERAAQSNV